MKKYLCFILGVLVAASAAGAALTVDTNLARDSMVTGTFSNLKAVSDGRVAAADTAASGDVSKDPQLLTIDLGTSAYIKSIKIFWDKGAYSGSYDLRVSPDSKNWFTELGGADAGTGVVDPRTGTVSQTISGKRFSSISRYVQIYIPLGSRVVNPAGRGVKIAEVQVFPAAEQKIAVEEVAAYVVTDKKAIVTVKTNIGAARASVSYGLAPDFLDQSAAIYETGQTTSATIYNLIPGRSYFYQVRAWDLYGNMAESRILNFAPSKGNAALGRKVLGTFTELPPRDPYVEKSKDVLSRLTDGGTSYFTSMATSRSIHEGDQFAVIDLGSRVPVSKVVTYWRNLAYPLSFDVSLSNDNVSYFDGAAGLDAEVGAFSRSDTGDPMRVVSAELKGTNARYVKIYIRKDSPCFQKHADWNFVQLMEVEVIPQ